MRTGLILARMDRPGQLQLEIFTQHPTIVTAHIDGREVLKTEPMLAPGQHMLMAPALALVPKDVSAESADDFPLSDEDRYLADLGVEPDREPKIVLPYIGEPGGVLKLRLGYFRYDNGAAYEFTSDELTFKVSSEEAFLRAVAENVHRIVIEKDPDLEKHGHLCGLANHFDPQRDY
jgi:hypothetical protein